MEIKAVSSLSLPILISNINVANILSSSSTLTLRKQEFTLSFTVASTVASYTDITSDIDVFVTVTGAGYFYSGVVTAVYNAVDEIHEAVFEVTMIPGSDSVIDYSFKSAVLVAGEEAKLVTFSGKTHNLGKDKNMSVNLDFIGVQENTGAVAKAISTLLISENSSTTIKAKATVTN